MNVEISINALDTVSCLVSAVFGYLCAVEYGFVLSEDCRIVIQSCTVQLPAFWHLTKIMTISVKKTNSVIE